MPHIKRTVEVNGEVEESTVFFVPLLNHKLVGECVNNKVIYDLKKRGRSEIDFGKGNKLIFEDVTKEVAEAMLAQEEQESGS